MATDKIGEVWSEIDHRFILDGQGRLKKVFNVDAVRSGIDNILRTRKGERCMLPTFGSVLADIVFEPLDSTMIKFLVRSIKEEIEQWDDRVIVEEVELYPKPDESSLSVLIHFRIKGFTNILTHGVEIKGEVV